MILMNSMIPFWLPPDLGSLIDVLINQGIGFRRWAGMKSENETFLNINITESGMNS